MKVFKRFRRVAELRRILAAKKWRFSTYAYDTKGSDYVSFDFKVKTLGGNVTGKVYYNTFNGVFFGDRSDRKGVSFKSSDDNTSLWFRELLETVYTNNPAPGKKLTAKLKEGR